MSAALAGTAANAVKNTRLVVTRRFAAIGMISLPQLSARRRQDWNWSGRARRMEMVSPPVVRRCDERIGSIEVSVRHGWSGPRPLSSLLPLWEKVARTKSVPDEGFRSIDRPRPLTRLASDDASHPLPQGERGRRIARP